MLHLATWPLAAQFFLFCAKSSKPLPTWGYQIKLIASLLITMPKPDLTIQGELPSQYELRKQAFGEARGLDSSVGLSLFPLNGSHQLGPSSFPKLPICSPCPAAQVESPKDSQWEDSEEQLSSKFSACHSSTPPRVTM